MYLRDLYSDRKKRTGKSGKQDVYQYDSVPIKLRKQIIHIWRTALGDDQGSQSIINDIWNTIYQILARRLGEYSDIVLLGPFEECKSFLLDKNLDTDTLLDVIELTFSYINHQDFRKCISNKKIIVQQNPDDAIKELNHRFREHAIGYQYDNDQIIRVDSDFIHAEVIVPALSLLSNHDFQGAEEEFRALLNQAMNQ